MLDEDTASSISCRIYTSKITAGQYFQMVHTMRLWRLNNLFQSDKSSVAINHHHAMLTRAQTHLYGYTPVHCHDHGPTKSSEARR